MIVADRSETSAPPIKERIPIREITSRFSGARTPKPPRIIPIEPILANPQRI